MTKSLNHHETRMLEQIATHGWFGLHVFDPADEAPPFSYSVGFTQTLGAPEFLIVGLPRALTHDMLWGVFRQIQAGTPVVPGQSWHDLLEGFSCIGMPATRPEVWTEYVISAHWFWRHIGREGQPEVIQLVWPSKPEGLFPWDEGCPERVRKAQPQLWG